LSTIQIIYLFAAACVSYVCSFSTGRRHASPTWFTLYTTVDNSFNRLAHEINILYTQRHAFCVVANQRRPQMDWPDLFSICSMLIKCVFRRIWRGLYTFFLDGKIPKISKTLWTYLTHPECVYSSNIYGYSEICLSTSGLNRI